MLIVSSGDNLHEMSKHFLKKGKYFKISPAENFTQSAEC